MIDLEKLEIKPLLPAENLNIERIITLLLNNLKAYAAYIALQEKLIGMFYSNDVTVSEVNKAATAVVEARGKVIPVLDQTAIELRTYQELMNAKNNLAS